MADRKPDADQQAYAALEELLRRVRLHRSTGESYLRLTHNQGGITGTKIATEESFKPNT